MHCCWASASHLPCHVPVGPRSSCDSRPPRSRGAATRPLPATSAPCAALLLGSRPRLGPGADAAPAPPGGGTASAAVLPLLPATAAAGRLLWLPLSRSWSVLCAKGPEDPSEDKAGPAGLLNAAAAAAGAAAAEASALCPKAPWAAVGDAAAGPDSPTQAAGRPPALPPGP